ncbi:DUF2690 domain-containing protein [Phaeacidiphilus oryzae]|uniref:DUF2690 domain-containing protein n=1 Tax=Phaeacidiphilus oryzae TaxID=348818 RepID=UPI00056D7DED|nr:DUF2690 domain-containing protein [Phaeacidiphilus oryzae]
MSVAAVVAAAVGAGAWLAVDGLGAASAGQAAQGAGLRAVVASSPAPGQGGGGAGTASVDRQLRGAPGPIAPVCSGPACQGLNPRTTGCDRGAHTIGSVTVDGLSLELRFSPRCRAAWAQAEGGPGARLREVAVASEDGRLLAEPLGPHAAPGRAAPSAGLSPMLSAADPAAVEACALVDDVEACAGAADHGGAPGRFGYLPPG